MRRLFVRIFLSIWLASALIGGAIAIVEATLELPTSDDAERPRFARALGTDTLPIRIPLVLGISMLVAYALARHLTRPLERLRETTQRIADGDLRARALPTLGATHVEVETLARDFDHMADRVEALLAQRDRLLADVAHELNSPIARLRVALELLRKRSDSGDAPLLDRIEQESIRLGALIDEILTLARLEGASPTLREIDSAALIEEVVADAAFEAAARRVRVSVIARGDAEVRVDGDRELLRRAIENVVRNAVRHTAEESEVEVEVELAIETDEIVVRVRDAGPGVPEAALDAIFEPMFRVEPDRDRRTGGVGLGLAIARRAIEAHGGAITARNRAGCGLEVTMRVPRRFTNLHGA